MSRNLILQLLEVCDYLGLAINMKKQPVMVTGELPMTHFLLIYISHLFLFLPAPTTIIPATPLHGPNSFQHPLTFRAKTLCSITAVAISAHADSSCARAEAFASVTSINLKLPFFHSCPFSWNLSNLCNFKIFCPSANSGRISRLVQEGQAGKKADGHRFQSHFFKEPSLQWSIMAIKGCS